MLHCIAVGRPKTRRAAELLRIVHANHGDLETRDNQGQILVREIWFPWRSSAGGEPLVAL